MGLGSAFWVLIYTTLGLLERDFELVLLRRGWRRFWCRGDYRFWRLRRLLPDPGVLAILLPELGAVSSEEARNGHAGSLRTDSAPKMPIVIVNT